MAGGHVLGDFAFMMREHQIHSAPVDVEFPTEVFLPHHRALQMPAREAFAPGARPVHDVLRFGFLPEGEVERSPFVALPVQDSRPLHRVVQIAAGQDAVRMGAVVFLDIEIDAPVADVGVTRIQNLLHGFDLFDDVAGGPGLDGRRRHIQQPHSLVIPEGVGLDDLHRLDLFQSRLLGDLVLSFVRIVLQMADIGNVPHVADPVSQMLQQPEQHVVGYARPSMTQVRVPVDGRTAYVHPHMSRLDRDEQFFLPRKGIGQIKRSHIRIKNHQI